MMGFFSTCSAARRSATLLTRAGSTSSCRSRCSVGTTRRSTNALVIGSAPRSYDLHGQFLDPASFVKDVGFVDAVGAQAGFHHLRIAHLRGGFRTAGRVAHLLAEVRAGAA